MPTKVEKDAITGQDTTGHEWDGIKELNTPLPKWWLYVFYATVIWAVVWWVLYPSWPGITGYFPGLTGSNQRVEHEERMASVRESRADSLQRIADASLEEIGQDPELLTFALAGGEASFADNCAPCHGLGGAGQGFYPTLADDSWIWGGTLDDIHTTLLYGIRSDHDETRFAEMPAFGDGILDRDQISAVAEHVLSLSGASEDPALAEEGAAIYQEQCAICHGEAGEGLAELGGPRLNDQIWLYGSSKPEIMAQIARPRHGVMPPWIDRLDPETIKILTVYVHSLGGGQ
ncbi:MAG: cytochrome-c oxidase, cbb3-type subunit III [Pseudomonadota bacterium]